MALNFDANQYEIAFRPTKLCNWEAAKKPSVLPKRRGGATKIIANDRGHLLPGIRKLNPWTDTCVPTQPALRAANRSEHSSDRMGHSDDILTSWEKRSSHVPFAPHELPAVETLPLATTNSRRSSIDKENRSHKSASSEDINSTKESQRSRPCHTPPRHTATLDQQPEHECRSPSPLSRRGSQASDPILASAYCNDVVAKNLRLHNQKHHTLADAVDVSARSSSSKSQWLDAEAKIDTWVPAVGRKLFQSPGPTQCSKLKIFRPKTTEVTQAQREESPSEKRPSTAPRTKRLSEMDLAIYWDVSTPTSPNETPPSPPETNMALVAAVADTKNDDVIVEDDHVENTEEQICPPALDVHEHGEERPCPPLERKHSSTSNYSVGSRKKRAQKSISTLPAATSARPRPNSLSDVRCAKLYASAPNLVNVGVQVSPSNLRATARMCEACNVKPSHLKFPAAATAAAEPYKLAFKAGKPNTLTIDDQTLERLYRGRHLSVPKPKMPYAKKSYSIGTLVPPFTVWPRAAGQDYPDHWRLASVYQHSYKPLETRKVPLMKTIFQ